LRLAFRILLNTDAGGEDFDVLEDGLDHGAELSGAGVGRVVGIRGYAGTEHVDVHAGSGESGDADDVVNLHRDGAHSLRNCGGQSAAGANRREQAVKNRLTLIDVGEDAASDGVFRFEDRSLGHCASDIHAGQVGSGQNGSELYVGCRSNHACGRRLSRPQSTSYYAKDQEGASACNDESEE